MTENDTKKDFDEIVAENVNKVFAGTGICDVLSCNAEDAKDVMAERNESVIKNAEEHGARVAHISIDDVDDMAFPFKDYMILASDGGIGVIGNIEPNELVETMSSIVKATLVRYGIDPDDKGDFNLRAAIIILLAATDFIGDKDMPHKLINRFSRLMETIEDLFEG